MPGRGKKRGRGKKDASEGGESRVPCFSFWERRKAECRKTGPPEEGGVPHLHRMTRCLADGFREGYFDSQKMKRQFPLTVSSPVGFSPLEKAFCRLV